MQSIFFKKQQLGMWRRDDGESKTHVSDEAMFEEIQQLVFEGWIMKGHGVTHLRVIEVTKDSPRGTLDPSPE